LGVRASLIASSCCTIPLALVFLFSASGVGSVTAALAIPKYKAYFVSAGTVFLLASIYLTIRRKSGGSCTLKDVGDSRGLILVSVVTYIVLTLFVLNLLLPFIAELLFS